MSISTSMNNLEKDYYSNLGEQLKQIREKMGLTQEELSEKIEQYCWGLGVDEPYNPIAVSTISKYENGHKIPAWYCEILKQLSGTTTI